MSAVPCELCALIRLEVGRALVEVERAVSDVARVPCTADGAIDEPHLAPENIVGEEVAALGLGMAFRDLGNLEEEGRRPRGVVVWKKLGDRTRRLLEVKTVQVVLQQLDTHKREIGAVSHEISF